MPVYIPTDNSQITRGSELQGVVRQTKELRDYGPPPRNYFTSRGDAGRYMIYADHSVSDSVTSLRYGATKLHPCSDEGRKVNPPPTYSTEFTFARALSPGFFHPPMEYAPPHVKWKYHPGGWSSALSDQLNKKGFNNTADSIETWMKNRPEDSSFHKEQTHVLYHPADRDSAVFKGEAEASFAARYVAKRKFSLMIVCPLVRADGIGWDRIRDRINRPPIYVRWGPGDQAEYEPLVLMCIPKPETYGGRESYHKDVDWFTMEPEPKSRFETMWNNMWKTYDTKNGIPQLMRAMEFPTKDIDMFMWTIVVLHRKIALGLRISDEHLVAWICQYGDHLIKCGRPHKAQPFKISQDVPQKKFQITYHALTAWILNPRFGNGRAHDFAKQFDDAFEALATYNKTPSDATWNTFGSKMTKARLPPW